MADSVAKVFTLPEGKFNLVFQLAAETKYGQTEAVCINLTTITLSSLMSVIITLGQVYAEKVLDLAVKVGTEAAKRGVDKFIEVSTAQVYAESKKKSKEGEKLEPWTNLAKYLLKAEEELRKIPNLNLIIVRPATVYGPGDINGLCMYYFSLVIFITFMNTFHFLALIPLIDRDSSSPSHHLRCCIQAIGREDEVLVG